MAPKRIESPFADFFSIAIFKCFSFDFGAEPQWFLKKTDARAFAGDFVGNGVNNFTGAAWQ